ncbi:MAG TPA: trigger factor [Acetobacteraceae bacterium]|jgi:trigger factor|nr:trigger factor [Acetobacteraceae bacterium]
MQVTETLSEGLKRAYTVVVPSAAIESRKAERLTELGKTLNLPGFRPGKVPPMVVRQRYASAVTAEVVEASVQEAVQQVLDERKLRPAQQPSVDLLNADAIAPTGLTMDLEFKVELEILPEVILPDFSAIELTRLKAEVTDEVLDKALRNLAARNRTLEEIPAEELAGRGAEKGEIAVVDYAGRVDGEEFPGGKATDAPVEIGGEGFIPGFAEQIEGIRPGETRAIEVTFPEEYGAKHLAGKRATFEVVGKAVKRAHVPDIDEAFAQKLSFDSVDELKDFIRGQIQREYDQLSRMRLKRQLLDKLNDLVSFDLPPSLVDAEFNQIWARLEADRKAGQLDPEDAAKDEEALRAEYRGIAERRVRLGLLLAEVGRVSQIGVTPDELTRAMRAEAANYPGQETQIMDFFRKNPRAVDTLRGPIFEEKVVDSLIGRARVTERAASAEELAKEDDASAPGAEPADSAQPAEGAEG